VPDILDLQVAAAPGGIVVISGVVSSDEHQRRAEAAVRTVKGIQRLVLNLTVS
jgi:osmotically-inducible protein OsmY